MYTLGAKTLFDGPYEEIPIALYSLFLKLISIKGLPESPKVDPEKKDFVDLLRFEY